MSGYREGDRVEFAPYLDRWMRGDRYGTVLADPSDAQRVTVMAEKSGDIVSVSPAHIDLVRRADEN